MRVVHGHVHLFKPTTTAMAARSIGGHQATAMAAASRSPALALLCASLLMLANAAASGDVLPMMDRFHAWRAAHNRTYATAEDRRHRFQVYCRNVVYIEATKPARGALVRARREPVHRPHERRVPGRAHHAARAGARGPRGRGAAAHQLHTRWRRPGRGRRRRRRQRQLLRRRLRPGPLQRRLEDQWRRDPR